MNIINMGIDSIAVLFLLVFTVSMFFIWIAHHINTIVDDPCYAKEKLELKIYLANELKQWSTKNGPPKYPVDWVCTVWKTRAPDIEVNRFLNRSDFKEIVTMSLV